MCRALTSQESFFTKNVPDPDSTRQSPSLYTSMYSVYSPRFLTLEYSLFSSTGKRHFSRPLSGSILSPTQKNYCVIFCAGTENRTQVSTLGRSHSTTKPYPRGRTVIRFRPSSISYRNTSTIVDQKPFSVEEAVMAFSSSIRIAIASPPLTTLNFCLISSSTPLAVPSLSIPDLM